MGNSLIFQQGVMHGLSWIGVWEFEPWIVCFLEQLNHGVPARDLAQVLHNMEAPFYMEIVILLS